MRTAFERDGDIRSVDLAAAFATLWRDRATGVLAFSQEERRVRFEILEGAVVGAFSSDPSFDTAEVLVRAGKLDPSALEGRRPTAGRDRARAAREQGLLTERDWRWGEKIRAVEILADLLTWLEGRYSFDRGETPEARDLRVGIERLLLELFLRSRDREFIHQALGATDAPLLKADDFDDVFPTLGLTPDALAVVTAIDGRMTAAEICRRVPPDPFSVQKLLAALSTLGLVHPEYAAEPKARPAGVRPTPPEEPPAPAIPPEPAKSSPRETPEPSLPQERTPRETEPAAPDSTPTTEETVTAEPPRDEPPIDLRIDGVTDTEPAVLAWDQAPPEPLDQPLDLPGPPVLLRPSRPGMTSIWLLAVLAAAVVALLVFRTRPVGNVPRPGPALVSTAVPTPLPTMAADVTPAVATPPAAVRSVETPSPTPIPATPVPPTATAPPPTIVPTRLPPTPSPGTGVTRAASTDRRQWLDRAARDREALAGDRGARYTIQLELVCELPSLAEAFRYDRGKTMQLLVSDYRGRECFRILWGRFSTLNQAIAARTSAPRFFFTPTNHPVVVSTRALLP